MFKPIYYFFVFIQQNTQIFYFYFIKPKATFKLITM